MRAGRLGPCFVVRGRPASDPAIAFCPGLPGSTKTRDALDHHGTQKDQVRELTGALIARGQSGSGPAPDQLWARPPCREYNSKTLLKTHMARLAGLDLPIRVAQVKKDTNFGELVGEHPWLTQVQAVGLV